jgi:hypothetical protein
METRPVYHRFQWLFALLPMFVYLIFAVPNIELPGVYYDEVLQVLPAMKAAGYDLTQDYLLMPGTLIGVGDIRIPLMTTRYLGSLETMLFTPVFTVLEPTVLVMRGTFILLGTLTILLAYIWAKQLLGIRGALIASLLLATDASYIFFTRVDNGPVDTMMLIKLGMLIAFTQWWKTRQSRWFYVGAFLAGLGVYDKANFLWLLGAGGLVLLIFGLRELWSRIQAKPHILGVGAAMAVFGGLPFFGYVVMTGGGPFRDMLSNFNQTAFHTDNSDFITNFGIRSQSMYELLHGYEAFNMYTTTFTGERLPYDRLPSLQPWLVVLAVVVPIIIYLGRRKPLDSRLRLSLGLALASVLMVAFSTFTPTNLSQHHLIIVYPFQQVLIVNSALLVIDAFRGTKRSRLITAGVWSVVALGILSNVLITVHNHQLLRDVQGTGMWSAAIYELNDYLVQENRPVACMDWGFCHNLQMLSKGALKTTDRWSTFLYPSDDYGPMQDLLNTPDMLFLFHAPKYTGVLSMTPGMDYPRQTLTTVSESAGLTVELVKTFYQANGEPVYEVYQVVSP